MDKDTNDNDNIKQFRQRWRSLEVEAPAGAKAPGRAASRQPHTQKQRIRMRLKAMIAFLVLAMVYYLWFMLEFPLPWWLNVYYELFMAAALAVQVWQLVLLRRMRLAEMSTMQAIEAIKSMLRLRMRAKVVLLSLAVPLVVLLVWVRGMQVDPALFHHTVWGAVWGGALGALIGTLIDMRFRRDFRAMIASLEGCAGDDADE